MKEIELLHASDYDISNTFIDQEEKKLSIKKDNKTQRNSQNQTLFEKNPDRPSVSYNEYLYSNLNKTVEDIYRNNNKFNHVNPMRISRTTFGNSRKSELRRHTKEEAIKELITNLKTQYILFNVKNFVRNYQIEINPDINQKNYKICLFLRNMSLYIYGLIIIFERPWFCYKGTTVPLPSYFEFVENCENISFANIPFITNEILRAIEILLTITITVTQILKYMTEYNLIKSNTGVNKSYNIVQVILFISLFLCFADSTYSLLSNNFPIINFLCRPFIYIYMIKRLRNNWKSILTVLWKTKKAYFILFINLISFSVIGYNLFKTKNGFFKSFGESVLQLYILLSTCNFPDIMLEAMEKTKFAIIFFVLCISINYFILLSYLHNLYNAKYYKVNKRDCLNIIKDVIDNKYNEDIFGVPKFERFLLKQKYLYHLTNNEYDNFLVLFNFYSRNSNLYNSLVTSEELTPEVEMIKSTKYGKYILESMKVEIIVNILYLGCTISISSFFPSSSTFFNNSIFLLFHFIFSCAIIYEPILLIKHLGIKRIIKNHFHRTLFHLFNIVVIVCLLFVFFLDKKDEGKKKLYDTFLKILRVFISFRTIRISVFLDKFRIIQNIYIIVSISKEMLNRNLLTLYSFILIFSTLSILLTGGKIETHSFDNNRDIPQNYVYINFNDFASSYISCFCLLMINNLHILVKSLTYKLNYELFFAFYFATFYFFATLILINIIQTLMLEMYLISDHSLSNRKKDDDKIKKARSMTINLLKNDEMVNGNETGTSSENKSKLV